MGGVAGGEVAQFVADDRGAFGLAHDRGVGQRDVQGTPLQRNAAGRQQDLGLGDEVAVLDAGDDMVR